MATGQTYLTYNQLTPDQQALYGNEQAYNQAISQSQSTNYNILGPFYPISLSIDNILNNLIQRFTLNLNIFFAEIVHTSK